MKCVSAVQKCVKAKIRTCGTRLFVLWKSIRLGRTDKKFCDAGCKDEYYNSIRSLEHREIGKN